MKLRFTTISSVILSPRMDKALYKGVDFKEIETNIGKQDPKKMDNINIVYPFYSYEDRDLLSEKSFSYAKEYHIPASSLKGALLVGKRGENEDVLRSKILLKDINIGKEDVELKNLYKFQYLYQEAKGENNNGEAQPNDKQNLTYKTPKFEPFFPGVAIEMIGIEKKFESEILLKADISEELLDNKLEESYSITKRKLDNYIDEIKQRVENINSWIKDGKLKKAEEKEDYVNSLKCIENNIESLIKDGEKILFLGGYKGILGSLTNKVDENQKVKNGFYIDEESMLPYGLVEVKRFRK